MSTSFKLAAAALVLTVGGCAMSNPATAGPAGAAASPPPTGGLATSPTPTPAPSAVSSPLSGYEPPELTGTFTSAMHGLSISYPAGWSTQAATEPWTTSGPFYFRDPVGDFFYDPERTDHLFIGVASQPLGDTPFEEWSTDFLAAEGCAPTGTVTIDGAAGVLGADCGQALVSVDGRGYVFWLYRSDDDPELEAWDSQAWFENLLATVQLDPDQTIDAEPTSSPGG